VRPGLIDVMTSTPGVAPYFDLSFQHASGRVLRSMRRFGDRERFTDLVERIREKAPEAGIRSNFIVGFPGETADDLRELELFLSDARLDAIGIFGYSDEDGTEAAGFADSIKVDDDEIARRVTEFADIAEEVMAQRAADRVGETVEVLIETVLAEDQLGEDPSGGWRYEGRAAHQAPDVDGSTTVIADRPLAPGDMVIARVTESAGADLVARV
jgi:tRNA A37 methylthiotransferase MiaB